VAHLDAAPTGPPGNSQAARRPSSPLQGDHPLSHYSILVPSPSSLLSYPFIFSSHVLPLLVVQILYNALKGKEIYNLLYTLYGVRSLINYCYVTHSDQLSSTHSVNCYSIGIHCLTRRETIILMTDAVLSYVVLHINTLNFWLHC